VTDVDLLEKKLAFIETCVRELRQLSQPERIAHDIREERFVAHTLQIAIQAALDIGCCPSIACMNTDERSARTLTVHS
jgi:uncharacterized protein YutE (UPF0331/DUF86 family)